MSDHHVAGPRVNLHVAFLWECACGATNVSHEAEPTPERIEMHLGPDDDPNEWSFPPLIVACSQCGTEWPTAVDGEPSS